MAVAKPISWTPSWVIGEQRPAFCGLSAIRMSFLTERRRAVAQSGRVSLTIITSADACHAYSDIEISRDCTATANEYFINRNLSAEDITDLFIDTYGRQRLFDYRTENDRGHSERDPEERKRLFEEAAVS
jgi:hypothetical protein